MSEKVTVEKLQEITSTLSEHHKAKKKAEASLKKYRLSFFKAASDYLQERVTLRQKTVKVEGPEWGSREELEKWVTTYHPGWTLEKAHSEAEKPNAVLILKEDPDLMKFSFVNEEDGQVYQRNVVEKAPWIDDESLAADHPEVWERLSRPIDPPPREIVDLSTADPQDLAIMQEYMIPGKLELKLEAPRKANAEELSDVE